MKEKKILLIDDDKLTRMNVGNIFKETCYQLDFAVDSISGLRKIEENHYDLVLLDIIMPDFINRQSDTAGIELLKKIKETKPNLPVIMFTVIENVKIAVDTVARFGARDYIVKDRVSKQEIVHKVEEVLKKSHQEPKKPPDLTSLIRQGENDRLEFKLSMRWNFESNKIDKKIEFAWLKSIVAFLNTDGGILLIGVKDDGTILGIEADNFSSEDKFLLRFSNLINRHIGPEFSEFINYELRPIKGKKILFVECEKSKKPVLLKKNKDEEEFYIRIGPSTRKLSMSKMLDYLGI